MGFTQKIGEIVLSVTFFVPFSQIVISSFMPGIDIPTNVAIWVSKYNNFADVPGYVAFHSFTRKGYWNEATYHYHFFRTN